MTANEKSLTLGIEVPSGDAGVDARRERVCVGKRAILLICIPALAFVTFDVTGRSELFAAFHIASFSSAISPVANLRQVDRRRFGSRRERGPIQL